LPTRLWQAIAACGMSPSSSAVAQPDEGLCSRI
jgi:hypothetical protein